jgi:hypothetical protein
VPELDTLFKVAEIAVAIAGFAAIVVLFRRRDAGTWQAYDGDRFNGMVMHALVALFFCFLPAVLSAFSDQPATVWGIASGLLAVWTVCHVAGVLRMATTDRGSRAALVLGFAVAGVLAMNALGVGFERAFAPYLIGVLWHVFQAAVLFGLLVFVRSDQMDRG